MSTSQISPAAASTPRSAGPAARVGSWIDTNAVQAFVLLTIFYVAATAFLSWFKLLWLDELITVHIALRGSPSAIWRALAQGADPNPPLTHLAVLACTKLFGVHTYAMRLPAMIAYWVGMLSLFLYMRRRVPPVWALLATVLSIGMGGFEWSYECRSYGIFYGLTMLALLCWSSAVDHDARSGRRWLGLAGMVLALMAALSTNYFSVLALVPIACGEAARTQYRLRQATRGGVHGGWGRYVDWSVWIGLLLALAPLAAFHPLIEHSISLYEPYAWNKVTFDATNTAYMDMIEAMLVPLGVLLLVASVVKLMALASDGERTGRLPSWMAAVVASARRPVPQNHRLRFYEVAPLVALSVYPYLGWMLALLHGGMLSARFVIPVCLGVAGGGAYLAYRVFGQHAAAGPVLLAVFLLWFAGRETYIGYRYSEQKDALFKGFAALRKYDLHHEYVAVTDNLLVLPFQYYAPPDLASRVVYPMDMRAVMRRRHEGSGEVNLWNGRDGLGFQVVPLAQFQHAVGSYLLFTTEPDWLIDDLNENAYPLDRLDEQTRTEDLNFVATPLSHGPAHIFRAYGDLKPQGKRRFFELFDNPVPFKLKGELPVSAAELRRAGSVQMK